MPEFTSPGGDGAIVAGGNTAAVLAALADAADETENPLFVAAGLQGFNGSTLDMIRSEGNDRDAIAVATLGKLEALGYLHGFNDTSWDRLKSEGNDRDAITALTLGCLMAINYPHLFNGTSWDRQRALGGTSLDGLGQAAVSLGIPGAGAIQTFITNADPGTTRATLITPAEGKRIRIISVNKSDQGSGTFSGLEYYFGTGANIHSNTDKAIHFDTVLANTPSTHSQNWGDGGGPVGAVDEVVSHRHAAADGANVEFIFTFREE
tara:strand:+ start:980 stop:1771 length:792 start_codon:yes stop_codon:yes gene_type:complete